MPIDRLQVSEWIDAYNELKNPPAIEDYIQKQVDKLKLEDPLVHKVDHEDMPEETHIADLIIADLPSYPNYNAPGS